MEIESNSMKKIGILTLVSADNCGSLLQAFAIRYAIRVMLKKDGELVPFFPKNATKMYRFMHLSYIKGLKNFFNFIKFYSFLKSQKTGYNNFRKDQLGLKTQNIKKESQLNVYCSQFDELVVGSDQVWNTRMFDFSPAYFASFFKGIKVSYAASLGGNERVEVPDALAAYKEQIEQFKDISVREPQGQEILSKFINKRIEVSVDPTLLIPTSVWDNIVEKRLVRGNYIFFYSYNYGDASINNMMSVISKKLNLPVYVINASRWIDKDINDYGFILEKEGGPLAFLSLMKYAKYAFVQSLHGSIFAYIFKRNLWFINSRENDVLDLRSENILNLLQIRQRVIRTNDYNDKDLAAPIVWKENKVLDQERQKSFSYLKKTLN